MMAGYIQQTESKLFDVQLTLHLNLYRNYPII